MAGHTFTMFSWRQNPKQEISLARQIREAALRSHQRRNFHHLPVVVVSASHRTRRRRTDSSRTVQAPSKNLPNCRYKVKRRIGRRRPRWPELPADVEVASQRLLGADQPLGSDDFVFHRLCAETAYPFSGVSLPDSLYIRRRALLYEATAVAFRRFYLDLSPRACIVLAVRVGRGRWFLWRYHHQFTDYRSSHPFDLNLDFLRLIAFSLGDRRVSKFGFLVLTFAYQIPNRLEQLPFLLPLSTNRKFE